MGSKMVDFLYRPLTDHTLNSANLYIRNISDIQDQYEYIHDYRRNATVKLLCNERNETKLEPDEQIRSPGILMVVEMEETTVDLRNSARVLDILVTALAHEGLEKVSSLTSPTINGAAIFVVVREGYIVARTYPEHRYCAIDIHLWSSFEQHDAVKMAFATALGTGMPSSYRIVAGGMFGVDTWKDDDKKRGPRVTQLCEENNIGKSRPLPMDASVARTLLEESVKLLDSFDQTIAVFCGERTDGCQSLDIISNEGFTNVIPLWACPGISQLNEFQEGSLGRMIQCEKHLRKVLLSSVSPDERIHAIILDPGASLPFTQVAYKVLHSKKSRLVQKDIIGIAVATNEHELWRRHFVERLRTEVILYDTNFRAEILFNNTDSSIELDVFSSGDPSFVHRIHDVIARIEKRTTLVSDLREIKGGLFFEDPNWHWTHFFLPKDYDQRSALEQYMSQRPVGYQTVLQLVSNEGRMALSRQHIKRALRDTIAQLESAEWSEEISKAEMHEGNNIGEGCVIAALWSGGTCVALWDGRDHIDLNIFTFIESEEFANDFASVFKTYLAYTLETALRDVQPRGYGRVVNFRKDIEPRVVPHWARFKE
jgi:S-adenosylmethionine/arginine decarboxylase-like enzyme